MDMDLALVFFASPVPSEAAAHPSVAQPVSYAGRLEETGSWSRLLSEPHQEFEGLRPAGTRHRLRQRMDLSTLAVPVVAPPSERVRPAGW